MNSDIDISRALTCFCKGRLFMERRLLSVRELADYIGISPQTIYNKVNRGQFPIPYKKVFGLLKWEREEVDRYLNKLLTVKVTIRK